MARMFILSGPLFYGSVALFVCKQLGLTTGTAKWPWWLILVIAVFWLIWSCGDRPQGMSVFIDIPQRQLLLGLLTAHIAKLFAPINGVPSPDFVGRLASASEGSVSTSFDFPGVTPNSAWYMQTKYGAMYWAMTARYRSMRYVPGRQVFREYPTSGGVY